MTSQPLDEFVANYAKAYVCEDARIAEIIEFFFCPCMFLRQDTVVLLDTPTKIRDFFAASVRSFRDSGCMNSVGRLVEGRRIGPRFALVDVAWTMTTTQGTPVMQFQTTYNLIADAGRWKIYAITRHD